MSFWRRKNLNNCQKKTCKPKRDSSLRSAAFRMTVEFLLRFVRNIGACHSDEGRISTIVRKRLVNQKEILHSAPLRSEWQTTYDYEPWYWLHLRLSFWRRKNLKNCQKRLVNQKGILHSASLRSEWQWNFCCVLLRWEWQSVPFWRRKSIKNYFIGIILESRFNIHNIL